MQKMCNFVPWGQGGSGEGRLNGVSIGRGSFSFLGGLEMETEETLIWFPLDEPWKQQYFDEQYIFEY